MIKHRSNNTNNAKRLIEGIIEDAQWQEEGHVGHSDYPRDKEPEEEETIRLKDGFLHA